MTPINTALCSFGMSGRVFHAPFLNMNPGFNFCAVWERTKNLAEKKYPGINTYKTLEDMLADDSIELRKKIAGSWKARCCGKTIYGYR
jgi:scyllo-inositol 2-dehydrogenase (NADP+)